MSTDFKSFLQTCRAVAASLKPNGEDCDNRPYYYAYLLHKWARECEARRWRRTSVAAAAKLAFDRESRQTARLRLKQLAEEGGRHEA